MIGALMFWRIGSALAQDISWRAEGGIPKNGSFEAAGAEGSQNLRIGIDYSPSVKAVNLTIKSRSSGKFTFGFLDKKELIKRGAGIKARYEFDLLLASGSYWDISNESKIAFGYIDTEYVFKNNTGCSPGGSIYHLLAGLGNYLKSEWRTSGSKMVLRFGGDTTGSNMRDHWGDLTAWDNHRIGADGSVEIPIGGMKLRGEASARRVKYNPERYFFVRKWTEDYRARTDLMIPMNLIQLTPSFEYQKLDIERDRRIDLMRPEYGLAIVRKGILGSGKDAFLKGVYAPWLHKKGHETLMVAGVNSSDLSGEIYRREIVDTYSSFRLKESIYGLRISWKFGEVEKEIRKGVSRYGEVVEDKYSFYRRGDSVKDEKSLTLAQQAERIGNARRRIEWSGSNLEWRQAPSSGFRFPNEAYAGRSGDCDEQSCMNNVIDRMNGYQSQTVAYWDQSVSWFVGHAVGIFQDPTNGQWFLDEYGMAYKITGLGPNATKEEAMRAGLAQNSQFLALKIKNPNWSIFTPWDCYDPNISFSPYYSLSGISTVASRPAIERGIELFTKRGFLFE